MDHPFGALSNECGSRASLKRTRRLSGCGRGRLAAPDAQQGIPQYLRGPQLQHIRTIAYETGTLL